MRRLFVFLLVLAGLYLAWMRFGPSRVTPTGGGDTTPAGNAANRIDRLSGAAPQ